MRARAAYAGACAVATAALALACGGARAPTSTAGVPSTTVAIAALDAGAQVDAADAGPGDSAESAPEIAITDDCTRKVSLRVALGDDKDPSIVEWIRCGPREMGWTADGGLAAPHDRLVLTAPGRPPTTLFDNAGEEDVVELDYVKPLALAASGAHPSRQIVYSVHSYGTGNMHDWRVVDRKAGALREWAVESPIPRWAKLLAPNEELHKQYELGVRFDGGTIVETVTVRKQGEPNCCPTGGLISAELVPGDGVLKLGRVWRSPFP